MDSNSNHIYINKAGESYFTSIEIPIEGFNHYVTDENPIFYIHNPEGPSSGTLTIEVTSMVHAIQPDESMLLMDDQFSDDYVLTDYDLPSQYIGIEVTERKRYTFEFLMVSGDLNDAEGYLYRVDGSSFATIRHNDSVILMPGSYYYRSSNDFVSVYSIRAVTTAVIETAHHIDFLESYNQITGSPQLQPKFSGTIHYFGEFIIYYFTLTEKKDIVFFQDNMFELYDSMSNRIDIVNLSNRFVYRLEAGDYFIIVTHPEYYTEDFFPVDYALYTFTLTKTTKISILSSYRAQLLKDNRIIDSSIENEEKTLEAGTYTIMCNTYYPTWTVRVMIKDSDVNFKHSSEPVYDLAIIPKESIGRKYYDFTL